MSSNLIIQLIGLVIGVTGAVLTVLWFGWGALLCIFLIIWSNNIAQRNKS